MELDDLLSIIRAHWPHRLTSRALTHLHIEGRHVRVRVLVQKVGETAQAGRCELCGEPAGPGGAICPACAASR